MTGSHQRGFAEDLRHSPLPVILVLAVGAEILGFVLAALSTPPIASVIVLLLGALGAVVWGLNGSHPVAARWFTASLPTALALVAAYYLHAPEVLPLTAISVPLAVALLGLPAGAIMAIGASAVLPLLSRIPLTVVTPAALVASLLGCWALLAVLWLIHSSVLQLASWSWDQFQRAQALLEEARNRQAELRQALSQLAHVNRQLAVTNDKLAAARLLAEEAQKSKSNLVPCVSHELRTPLNMILGLLDVMTQTPDLYGPELPPSLMEDLAIMQRNCEHLTGMINDILDLSQVEAGRLALHKRWVSMADLIEGALPVVQPLLAKKHLTLLAALAPSLPEVFCDPGRIRQVIVNLLSNAARYTDRGQVTLRVGQQGEHMVVSVEDTGPGIAPEEAAHIFEPFYQGAGGGPAPVAAASASASAGSSSSCTVGGCGSRAPSEGAAPSRSDYP